MRDGSLLGGGGAGRAFNALAVGDVSPDIGGARETGTRGLCSGLEGSEMSRSCDGI